MLKAKRAFKQSRWSPVDSSSIDIDPLVSRTSRLFCDGVADCLQGEDEDGELCYKPEIRRPQLTTTTTTTTAGDSAR